MRPLLILLLLGICGHTLYSQTANPNASSRTRDSLDKEKASRRRIYSSPRKAAVLSAVLPGLGQVYNKKVWKVPVIYAGLGAATYFYVSNNKQYSYYRKNLIAENDGDASTVNTTIYNSDQLLKQKKYYQKYRDYSGIAIGLIYLLNIIDAHVDAHLRTFDVSDDLSIRLDPWQEIYPSPQGGRTANGISIKVTFK